MDGVGDSIFVVFYVRFAHVISADVKL